MFIVAVQFDGCRRRLVHLRLWLLGEGVLGNSLEGLLHVDALFRTGLKVRNVVLAFTPVLSSFSGHLRRGGGRKKKKIEMVGNVTQTLY